MKTKTLYKRLSRWLKVTRRTDLAMASVIEEAIRHSRSQKRKAPFMKRTNQATNREAATETKLVPNPALALCPACGVFINTLPNGNPHHKWNEKIGEESRLVCRRNPSGVKDGAEYKQPI